MMIKELIFDLGGVYFEAGTKIIKNKLLSMVPVSKEIVDEVFEAQPRQEGFLYRNGKISKEDFWKVAKSKLKVDDQKINEIREVWHQSYKPIPGMKELVQNLRTNYRVIAFSGNVKERVEYLDKKYGLMSDFDAFVLSYEVGCSKLEIDFFRALIKNINCEPGEALIIDDNQKFIETSKSLGFKGILFKDVEQVKKDLKNFGVMV